MPQIILIVLLLSGSAMAQTPTPSPTPTPNKYCTLNLPSAAYQAWKAAHCN